MTDAAVPVIAVPDPIVSPFTILGSADADACEGDFCVIPDHHEQAVVNRALDSDNV